MKKLIGATALAAVTLLALTACAGTTPEPSGTEPAPTEGDVAAAPLDEEAAALLPDGTDSLISVTDPTFAPFQFYDEANEEIIGWTADMITALGQTLGVEIPLEAAAFDTILPGVASGKYDLAASAFTVTEERLENADMVTWGLGGTGVAVPEGNPKDISTDPLSMCGLRISASKGTSQAIEILPAFQQACADAGKPKIEENLFPSGQEALLALSSGRTDGHLNDTISIAYEADINGGFEVAPGDDIDSSPFAFALAKDSPLTPAFEAAMAALIDNGTYDAINEKWAFPATAAITADQISNE
ncbi:ABC transporter substrate-binding protein [Microbacterium sp. 179-I 3D3 NHS]|uniref:ABC transporter substrate-binding protein n=1 Tax=Microbacterium sp. 179-I 3D3 NHS TaxID=3142382 RepID=UPI0039A10CE7